MSDLDTVRAALPAYDIGGELGRGGWGVVLAGEHRQLGRRVAIKQLPAAFAADTAIRDRFTTEARLLASLDHPHVVPVYDFVQQDGLCLLVMELLPGGTVWSRFTTAGISAPSAVAVALACSAGLKAAHDRGILHRDVKPENIMFSGSGTVKITDFGIAKVLGGGETLATRSGEVLGTPAYIAPEQARGLTLSPATDVYAVATMLYELLAGVLPFTDDGDTMSLLFRHAFEAPTPIEETSPGIPPALAAVVMRGLATDPAQRFPTADSFGQALAAASTTYWGPGWLSAQGLAVLGAETMTSGAAPTLRPGLPPPPPPPINPGPLIRPAATVHAPGVVLANVAGSDLVPVQRIVAPRTRVPLALAGLLAVLTVLIAVLGLGTPSRGGTLTGVTVGGHASSGRPPIDLTARLPITVRGAGASGDRVRLSLEVLGATVVSRTAPLHGGTATLPALGARYLIGGHLTAELAVLDHGTVTGSRHFAVRTTQPAVATAPAAVDAVLLLFSLAYVESNLRTLRRGRGRVTASIGAAVAGALVGVGAVTASWVVAGREPTVPALVVSAVLAAAAAAAAALACSRIGARYRRRRA